MISVSDKLAVWCHRNVWSLQEPPVETRNLVVELRGRESFIREACTFQGLQFAEDWRHDEEGQVGKTAYIFAKRKICHLADKVWDAERRIRHSIPRWWWCFPYRQTNKLQKNRTLLVTTVFAMMLVSLHSLTKTRWRHGLSTMLGCSMFNLCGQKISSLRSLQLLVPPSVCMWPRSTKHLAK